VISFAGIDGGFDNNEAEYEETHNIVILPSYVTLPFPSVELPEKVLVASQNPLYFFG
jgi:ubiquitin carboxyl-terminal hydrolase 5/13